MHSHLATHTCSCSEPDKFYGLHVYTSGIMTVMTSLPNSQFIMLITILNLEKESLLCWIALAFLSLVFLQGTDFSATGNFLHLLFLLLHVLPGHIYIRMLSIDATFYSSEVYIIELCFNAHI